MSLVGFDMLKLKCADFQQKVQVCIFKSVCTSAQADQSLNFVPRETDLRLPHRALIEDYDQTAQMRRLI